MTDSTSQRWIEVDDVDSRINYVGAWFADTYANPAATPAPGDLNQGTARGTTGTASLSFSYEGGNMDIWGTSTRLPGTGATIACTVDGKAVESASLSSSDTRERWPICRMRDATVGPHSVVLNITVTDGNAIFVDTISYYSLANADLTGKYSEISGDASGIQAFGLGWQSPFTDSGERLTNTEGSRLSVPFYGTSIEIRGYLQPSFPRVPTTATFSIDGGPVRPFTLPVYTDGFRGTTTGSTRWRAPLLVTPPVSNGQHTIDIIYRGNSTTVPFTVDYFVVAHQGAAVTPSTNIGDVISAGTGTGTATGSKTTGTSTNTKTNGPGVTGGSTGGGTGGGTNDPSTAKSSNTGAIVGGVVGGIALLAIVAIIFFFLGRRRKRNASAAADTTVQSPFDPTPAPVWNPQSQGPVHLFYTPDHSPQAGASAMHPSPMSSTHPLHSTVSSTSLGQSPFGTPPPSMQPLQYGAGGAVYQPGMAAPMPMAMPMQASSGQPINMSYPQHGHGVPQAQVMPQAAVPIIQDHELGASPSTASGGAAHLPAEHAQPQLPEPFVRLHGDSKRDMAHAPVHLDGEGLPEYMA